MKRWLAALALTPWTGLATAGDAAEFQTLGFSADGRYYAFAQVGVQDGSGFPYAGVAVVEVPKNTLAASEQVVLQAEGPGNTTDRALQRALAAVKLDRFGIGNQKIAGAELFARRPTETDPSTPNLFRFTPGERGPGVGQAPQFEALVETTKGTPPADDPFCADLGGPQLLKLSIVGRAGTDGATRVLQQDRRLPKSRACPFNYQVRRIAAHAGGLVVVLSYSTPGFEGPNLRYMVVSGSFGPPQR